MATVAFWLVKADLKASGFTLLATWLVQLDGALKIAHPQNGGFPFGLLLKPPQHCTLDKNLVHV